jgi:hypothetical protein
MPPRSVWLLTRCGKEQATPQAGIYNPGWMRKHRYAWPQSLVLLSPLPISQRWIRKPNPPTKLPMSDLGPFNETQQSLSQW